MRIGVAWIQEKHAEGETVATSRALSEDWQNRRYEPAKLWAYRPLEVEAVPEGKHPVDWFINRKLADAGLSPAPASDPGKLARRIHFGLTGLPPDPEVIPPFVSAFQSDPGNAVVNSPGI